MSRISSGMRALVLWSREKKTGIENVSCVPSNSRFAGAVTTVMFSGDKKFYPAKVLAISADNSELERKEQEAIAELSKAVDQPAAPKRGRRVTTNPGVASDRAVAAALGGNLPVPKNLQPAHLDAQKKKREIKSNKLTSQLDADKNALSQIKRSLFDSAPPSTNASELMADEDLECSDSDEDSDGEVEELRVDKKWSESCGCCEILQKYDSAMFLSFLRDLCSLYEHQEPGEAKYLELLPISPDEKKVELVQGKGVYISLTDKDQLKVDFRNKPSALTRETLFTLYGREPFRVLPITGRGKKKGSYTIPENVLKALCIFVNRNVHADKALKTDQLAKIINKRAPEWRKYSSPGRKKKSVKESTSELQVVSTSPFKVSPIKPSLRKLASPAKHIQSKETSSLQSISPQKLPSPLKPISTENVALEKSPPFKHFEVSTSENEGGKPSSFSSVLASALHQGGYGEETNSPLKSHMQQSGGNPWNMQPAGSWNNYYEHQWQPYNQWNGPTY